MSTANNPVGATAQTRNEVWSQYYGAEYAFRYYQSLGDEFLEKHNQLRFWTLILGGGAGIGALVQMILPFAKSDIGIYVAAVVLGAFGIALAIVSNTNMVGDYARKASRGHSISKSCGEITRQLTDLLASIDRMEVSDIDARKELNRLATLVSYETFTSEAAGIVVEPESEKSKQAADAAYNHLETLYAH